MKKRNIFVSIISGLVVFNILGYNIHSTKAQPTETPRPIIVQSPMPIEAVEFFERIENIGTEKSGTFVFYLGKIDDYPVILSKTGKGMVNGAAATALAIEKYNPLAIINQGTSGGHHPDLYVYDIVLGKRTVNIGSFITGQLDDNEGIEPKDWKPMDLLASEGAVDEDSDVGIRYFKGDDKLLEAANAVKDKYQKGKIIEGTIGSADVWNREMDRIQWLHDLFDTDVEDMEAAAVAQVAASYDIPFLGIRILSNNITNQGEYKSDTAIANQEYVYQVVKQYISSVRD